LAVAASASFVLGDDSGTGARLARLSRRDSKQPRLSPSEFRERNGHVCRNRVAARVRSDCPGCLMRHDSEHYSGVRRFESWALLFLGIVPTIPAQRIFLEALC